MTTPMNQSITLKSLTSFVAAVLLAFPASASAAQPKSNPANPDFTKGDAIPAQAKHEWNLGPMGLRGWMFCDIMVTTDARHIQGSKALAGEVAKSPHRDDPIVRSFNALALLASGDPAWLPLVKKKAQWAAGYSSRSMQTWHYGYVMMLLSEYVLATGDLSVMPGLRRLALGAARGQGAVGSWGHGFARPTAASPK